jgi:hypothetical protein
MNEQLRPSNLGEILDRTLQMYRARFLVFFGIASIPAGVVLVCAAGVFLFFAWLGSAGLDKTVENMVGGVFLLASALVLMPVCVAATGLGSGALTQAAATIYLGGATTIRDAWRSAWKRGWRYLWLFVLEALLLAVAPFIAWMIVFVALAVFAAAMKQFGGSTDMNTVLGLLVLLLLAIVAAYAVWMLLRICLSFPACVVEDMSAWASVKRAGSLSKGTRGRLLVLYLLGAILGWVLSMLLTLPVIIVASLIPAANTPQHSDAMGRVFLFTLYGAYFAVQALTKPLYGIALVVFYYDQRIRNEAFDIEWMMEQAGLVAAPVMAAETAPWMPAAAKKSQGETETAGTPKEDTPQTEPLAELGSDVSAHGEPA